MFISFEIMFICRWLELAFLIGNILNMNCAYYTISAGKAAGALNI